MGKTTYELLRDWISNGYFKAVVSAVAYTIISSKRTELSPLCTSSATEPHFVQKFCTHDLPTYCRCFIEGYWIKFE